MYKENYFDENSRFKIDLNRIKENCDRIKNAFEIKDIDFLISYAIKANNHDEIIKTVLDKGLYLELIPDKDIEIAEGYNALNKSIVNGVAKYRDLNQLEKLVKNDSLIIIDSEGSQDIREIYEIDKIAKEYNKIANVGLRLQVKDFSLCGKLGMNSSELDRRLIELEKSENVNLTTLHSMPGYQIINPKKYSKLLEKLYLISNEKNIDVENFDLGGGFASELTLNKNGVSIDDFAKEIKKTVEEYGIEQKIILEPGRYIAEDAGTFLTEVLDIKNNNEVILDSGFNFLIPLDSAKFYVKPLKNLEETEIYNFSGRIGASGDIIAKKIESSKLEIGDKVLIENCGAYTLSMSSDFCIQKPKIIVDGDGYEK